MPAIATARSSQNIRRTCSLVNEISSSPRAVANGSGKNNNNSASNSQTTAQSQRNSKLYKTELCRTWMDCGRCNYGDKCQYAHGEQERRPVSRHPKYKTEFCQPFHQVGYCPYGPRCNFIHNEEQPPLTLKSRVSQINCNGNNKVNGNSTSDISVIATTTCAPTATTSTTVPTSSLTFGIWQAYCNSTGESPVPSSTTSSNDSPIASTSPNLDFDENTGAVVVSNGWSTFSGKDYSNLCHFNWPTVTTSAFASEANTEPSLDAGIIDDLLDLTVDEKKLKRKKKMLVSKTTSESAVICAPSGRLPVFAQLSNPSSAS
ncbi:unnamed protein product [Thelazia callipaeda]|uniref:C3H1-type domain-containing protein n=1 Tax=Thelazia callipaeda TaxID=103827 RepID=A0A0N5D3S2_THECL|nr:unnamed protein product [Thelazia callipaeda]